MSQGLVTVLHAFQRLQRIQSRDENLHLATVIDLAQSLREGKRTILRTRGGAEEWGLQTVD